MSQSTAFPDTASELNPNNWNGTSPAQTAIARGQSIIIATDEDHDGADIMTVCEIKGRSDVSRLPKQTAYLCGTLNLRDTVIPTVDRRGHLGHGFTRQFTS